MIDLGHVTLMLLAALVGAWIWRGLGLRDQALRMVRQHCQRTHVQLLDESIALNRLRLGRGRHGRPGLLRRYGFEFTVTGERRYAGFIELHGSALLKIELAPHPFPGDGPEPPPPRDNVHYLQ
ncbi:DUF3301 domain-containing protein [Pseudomonas sp. FME51]|uniref:DUF3301 domain-containing protein n=1 Tax=Pseudomonas sp. FME51 TaxID=2742609 RepID=UPI00186662A6|nr:DUF3301 domain-containing protein [Pseudomonas sp. FME51]